MGSFQYHCAITHLPIRAGAPVLAFTYNPTGDFKDYRSTRELMHILWSIHGERSGAFLRDMYIEKLAQNTRYGLGKYDDSGWVEDEAGATWPDWQGWDVWMVHRFVLTPIQELERELGSEAPDPALFSLVHFAFCTRIQLFPSASDDLLGQQYADKGDRQRHELLVSLMQQGIKEHHWY
jgi:hypothetical protein